MARIRTVKPEFFANEELQDLEAANPGAYCMLVYAGLWGHCSKDGVFEFRPRTLKLSILPFLDYSMADTLALLEQAGFVRRFCVDGKEYGYIASFEKHQRISGKEAQHSPKLPSPPMGSALETMTCGDTATVKQEGSNREAPEKQPGAQEKEREKERDRIKTQQQRASARDDAAADLPTTAEQVFERCFETNAAKIRGLFPEVDFDLERAKCVAHYRSRSPPVDPLLTVVKWFERSRAGLKTAGKGSLVKPPSLAARKQQASFDACRRFVEKRRGHDQG